MSIFNNLLIILPGPATTGRAGGAPPTGPCLATERTPGNAAGGTGERRRRSAGAGVDHKQSSPRRIREPTFKSCKEYFHFLITICLKIFYVD